MKQTVNIKLNKPEYSDVIDIEELNENFDVIDKKISEIAGEIISGGGSGSISVATPTSNGLMSAADKAKLDGIAADANKTVVDAALDGASENPVQNKAIAAALDGKASAVDVADLKNSVGKLEGGVAEIVKNNLFDINITDGNDTAWAIENGIASRNVASNKTFSEILTASKAGKQLQCVYGHAVYRNVVNDNKSMFVFEGASGYTGDTANPFGIGRCPTVRIEITADAVVMRMVGGELPVPNVGADNGKMLIVADGKWVLQDVAGTTVDSELSTTSKNPVENKIVTDALNGKLPRTGGTITGALRVNDSFSTGGSIGFGAAPVVLAQAADDAAQLRAGAADVDDNPPPLARLKVAAPTEDDDAATKQYVDRSFNYAPVLTSPVMIRKEGATVSAGVYLHTVGIGNQAEIMLDDVNENYPVAISNLRTPTGDGSDSYAATKGYVDSKVAEGGVVVDGAMSATSANPVQNKAIHAELSKKANSTDPLLRGTVTVADASSGANVGLDVGPFGGDESYAALELSSASSDGVVIGGLADIGDAEALGRGDTAVCYTQMKNYVDGKVAEAAASGGSTTPITITLGTGGKATSSAGYADICQALTSGRSVMLVGATGKAFWHLLSHTVGNNNNVVLNYADVSVSGGAIEITRYTVTVTASGITYSSGSWTNE